MGEHSFGAGHACQTPVMTFTPFFLGNDVRPKNYVRNQNYGAQISITVPLDGGMQELCKQLAKEKVAKEKLRYELERLKNCAEVLSKGFTFHRDSPFWVLCGDVVPWGSFVGCVGIYCGDATISGDGSSLEDGPARCS